MRSQFYGVEKKDENDFCSQAHMEAVSSLFTQHLFLIFIDCKIKQIENE